MGHGYFSFANRNSRNLVLPFVFLTNVLLLAARLSVPNYVRSNVTPWLNHESVPAKTAAPVLDFVVSVLSEFDSRAPKPNVALVAEATEVLSRLISIDAVVSLQAISKTIKVRQRTPRRRDVPDRVECLCWRCRKHDSTYI